MRPRGRFKLETYMSIKSYYNEVMEEMKHVVWPSRSHTINATFTVILVSVAIGAYLFAVDLSFKDLLALIIKK